MQRILVVGTRPLHKQRLLQRFKGRCTLKFFDDPTGSSGVSKWADRVDLVILNSELARHSHMYVLRTRSTPLIITKGATSSIARAIEAHLEACKRTSSTSRPITTKTTH